MNTVTVKIDVTKPAGRKLVKDLETKKCVKVEYPFVGKSEKTYTHEQVFKSAENVLNEYFGTNLKLNI